MILDASKVALAAWATLKLDPYLEKNLPYFNKPMLFFFSAFTCAILLEFIYIFAIGRPKIKIIWRDDKNIDLSGIKAKISRRSKETKLFKINVILPDQSYLGRLILNRLINDNVRLRIGIERAEVKPICDKSSNYLQVPAVVACDKSACFSIQLGKVLKSPGLWQWGEVRWKNTNALPNNEYTVDYWFTHDKKLAQFLLNHCIKISSETKTFKIEE